MEIPIKQTVPGNSVVRYSVPFQIANAAPVDAMLDTGAVDLRLLPGAAAGDAYALTARE